MAEFRVLSPAARLLVACSWWAAPPPTGSAAGRWAHRGRGCRRDAAARTARRAGAATRLIADRPEERRDRGPHVLTAHRGPRARGGHTVGTPVRRGQGRHCHCFATADRC